MIAYLLFLLRSEILYDPLNLLWCDITGKDDYQIFLPFVLSLVSFILLISYLNVSGHPENSLNISFKLIEVINLVYIGKF